VVLFFYPTANTGLAYNDEIFSAHYFYIVSPTFLR